jgi:hypothetical protein
VATSQWTGAEASHARTSSLMLSWTWSKRGLPSSFRVPARTPWVTSSVLSVTRIRAEGPPQRSSVRVAAYKPLSNKFSLSAEANWSMSVTQW